MRLDDSIPFATADSGRGALPKLAAGSLLPIVRAALARGEGPPALLRWVRRHGPELTGLVDWTSADETRARVLARRLAEALNAGRLSHACTYAGAATLAPASPCA